MESEFDKFADDLQKQMNNIFDRYYKRYDSWYDRNKFAYLSELKAIKKMMPEKEECILPEGELLQHKRR